MNIEKTIRARYFNKQRNESIRIKVLESKIEREYEVEREDRNNSRIEHLEKCLRRAENRLKEIVNNTPILTIFNS